VVGGEGAAQAAAHLVAVHVRQHHVEQHDVRQALHRDLERLASVLGGQHLETVALELDPQHVAKVGLVLDHQDFLLRHFHREPSIVGASVRDGCLNSLKRKAYATLRTALGRRAHGTRLS
jgi:hypothetical protein